MMSLNQKIENIEKNQMIFLGLKMTILKLKKITGWNHQHISEVSRVHELQG